MRARTRRALGRPWGRAARVVAGALVAIATTTGVIETAAVGGASRNSRGAATVAQADSGTTGPTTTTPTTPTTSTTTTTPTTTMPTTTGTPPSTAPPETFGKTFHPPPARRRRAVQEAPPLAPAPPSVPAAVRPRAESMPNTGAEPGVQALLGMGMLMFGAGLRLRVARR